MTEIKKIPVENLKPGMIFNKSVYIDGENLFVESNVPLEEDDIKRLMKWGVIFIETEGDIIKQKTDPIKSSSPNNNEILAKYEQLLNMRKRLIEVHGNACFLIEQVYAAIRKDNPIDLPGIQKNVKEIIGLLKENSNVFIFLNGFDDVERNYLVTHSVNVAFYSLLIGLALNYTDDKLLELGTGTILIDAGMTKVPVYIVHKQSNLTDSEFHMIKAHPIYGYKVLTGEGISETIAAISFQHHEQFDGKGYPRGLKGKEISEYARIATIADSYESQISKRSYRKKVGSYHAMQNLLESGVGKFDPELIRVFLFRMSRFPIGSLIELNDKSVGIVIGSIAEKPLRPIIKLIFDSNREKISDTHIINLVQDTTKFISRVLDEKEAGISLFDVLWRF